MQSNVAWNFLTADRFKEFKVGGDGQKNWVTSGPVATHLPVDCVVEDPAPAEQLE